MRPNFAYGRENQSKGRSKDKQKEATLIFGFQKSLKLIMIMVTVRSEI